MSERPVAVVDACVLVNFALCDTLLRLAEPPALFDPRWSDEIVAEATRALEDKLGWPPDLTSHFDSELRLHFAGAWIRGHEPLIPRMTNDPKDRHLLAAAVHAGVDLILTLNLRHFRPADLDAWGVVAIHPQDFLLEMFRQEPALVLGKLREQAKDRNRPLDQLLDILRTTVPEFVAVVSKQESR